MGKQADHSLLAKLDQTRQAFLAVVDDVRPDLHRYCARMTGSVVDGEDVVQDVLARAYYELSTLKEVPELRPWLFRMAHNRAIDHLRRYERRYGEPLDAEPGVADDAITPEQAVAQEQALRAALKQFLGLPPAQRSAVILKDVLDHSVVEIAALLDLSVPAVSAALHRGRTRLRELARASASAPNAPAGPVSPALARYAALFNSRNWDEVRAMLADDVRLDLVAQWKRSGRRDVSDYFTNYERLQGWRLVPGWLDGREVLALQLGSEARPAYFIELEIEPAAERVLAIRDFRYAPYIGREAPFEQAEPPGS
jgi:RNA polymerase sigma factor (sigma-70 family)